MHQDLKWWYCHLVFTYAIFGRLLITTKIDITDQYTYI
jgi:hypothetical protein